MSTSTEEESFRKFGTFAFSHETMLTQIFFGYAVGGYGEVRRVPGGESLCLALWFAMVPEVYQEPVLAFIKELEEGFLGNRVNEKLRLAFVTRLHTAIQDRLEPNQRQKERSMFPGETVMSGAPGHLQDPNVSEFKVMRSPAGWYVGTTTMADGYEAPNTRETNYFNTEGDAKYALEVFHKTNFLPGRRA